METKNRFATQPIPKLLLSVAIPVIVGNVINAVYNIVDRYFVGNYVGEDALAGLSLAYPFIILFTAFLIATAVGCSTIISVKIGQNKDDEELSEVLGTTITTALAICTVFIVGWLLFSEQILDMFKANEPTLKAAKDYTDVVLIGFYFQYIAFIFSFVVRCEGKAMLSMVSLIISAVTNIALDALFIITFDMGVKGAALATAIAQLVGFIFLFYYLTSGKSRFKLGFKYLKPNFTYVKSIANIGLASFILNVGFALNALILNALLLQYGGDAAVASNSAINSLYTVAFMSIISVPQGAQPVIAYNFGAKSYDRVKQALFYCYAIACAVGLIYTIAFFAFAEPLIGLFIDAGSDTMPVAINGLRLFSSSLVVLGLLNTNTAFLQASGNAPTSTYVNLARMTVILAPIVYIFPRMFGLNGVWLIYPGIDFTTTIISLIIVRGVIKKQMSPENAADTTA